MKQTLMWLDLETTGLLPWNCAILEVGAIINGQKYQSVVKQPYPDYLDRAFEAGEIDEYVYKMHTKSGLWEECRTATKSIEDIEEELIGFIKDNTTEGKVLLAGNTVHFDKKFLEYYCSDKLISFFDYRVLDVSTLKKIYDLFFNIQSPIKKEAHRAIEDILESQQEFDFYMELLKPQKIKDKETEEIFYKATKNYGW
jgi:oligoribonuclease